MSVQKQKVDEGNRKYYMDGSKFIRDLVHGYVYLTKFDLTLIDTPEFQRLKDIRQLTCQNVYPSARHTRFEHSLGVLELTRRALTSLNQNGILVNAAKEDSKPLFPITWFLTPLWPRYYMMLVIVPFPIWVKQNLTAKKYLMHCVP